MIPEDLQEQLDPSGRPTEQESFFGGAFSNTNATIRILDVKTHPNFDPGWFRRSLLAPLVTRWALYRRYAS